MTARSPQPRRLDSFTTGQLVTVSAMAIRVEGKRGTKFVEPLRPDAAPKLADGTWVRTEAVPALSFTHAGGAQERNRYPRVELHEHAVGDVWPGVAVPLVVSPSHIFATTPLPYPLDPAYDDVRGRMVRVRRWAIEVQVAVVIGRTVRMEGVREPGGGGEDGGPGWLSVSRRIPVVEVAVCSETGPATIMAVWHEDAQGADTSLCQSCGQPAAVLLDDGSTWCRLCDGSARRLGYDDGRLVAAGLRAP